MSKPILLLPAKSRALRYQADLQDFCATLSIFVQEDVGLWSVDEDDWAAAIASTPSIRRLETVDHHGDPIDVGAPMSAAPFRFRDDGRPDWATMWQGFCELALYGGPPHRGKDAALGMPPGGSDEIVVDEMVEEIIRGIEETTGLIATPAPGGWLRIMCDSKRMAAWMCATIVLENVDARMEGAMLFVPGAAGFDLKNEVKSVITVVAKTKHYWQEHIANENGESEARAQARRLLAGENIQRLAQAS
jgi:sirohydrochlorin cobaltochelatase